MANDAKLYNEEHLQIMKTFDALSDMNFNRIELIRDLALGLNYKTIGLANCVMFNRETKVIAEFLAKDFSVHSVNCKYGRLREKRVICKWWAEGCV